MKYAILEAGTHTVTLSSSGFAPGIYFYTLIKDNFPTETRKMIILE